MADSCQKATLDDPGPEPLIAPPFFESRRRKIREVRSFMGESVQPCTPVDR